jgi:hypothetical protein
MLNENESNKLEQQLREASETALAHKYRTLEPGETPTMDFYLVDQNGVIHEAVDPLFLLVHATGEWVDDCEYTTTLIIGAEKMREVSRDLAMWGTYSKVYDAIGMIFDPNSKHAEFANLDDPIMLDAFGPYTVLQSYVKSGKYRIFEKVPYLTKTDVTLGCLGCKYHDAASGQCAQWRNWNTNDENGNFVNDLPACQHRVPAGQVYDGYVEVTVDNMTDPSYLPEWKPFNERMEDYEHARRNWTDSKQ